jgi:hypothetical protein
MGVMVRHAEGYAASLGDFCFTLGSGSLEDDDEGKDESAILRYIN